MKLKAPVFSFTLVILFLLSSCGPNSTESWQFSNEIPLEGVGIIGLEYDAEEELFWISDGDNNRLIRADQSGEVVEDVHAFSRPMHLSYREGILYVAEYGADRIVYIAGEDLVSVPLPQAPDAPAGVDVDGRRMAVADFYNHRILLWDESGDLSFGIEGSEDGDFHYPTQVRFFEEKLYVADAYNHRVQVFDSDNNHLKTIGAGDGMDATTGIFVDESGIYATDFENSRLLIYSHEGELIQTIDEQLDKPTAVIKSDNKLFIANYRGQSISVFEWR